MSFTKEVGGQSIKWEDTPRQEFRRAVWVRRLRSDGPGRRPLQVQPYVTAYIPPLLCRLELPRTFDAALARARRIAAAWKRIQAKDGVA